MWERFAVRKDLLGMRQEPRMPKAEQDPRGQCGLPITIRRDDPVHEG